MGGCRGLVLSAVGIVKRTRTLVPTSTSEGKVRETKVTAATTNDSSSDSEADHGAHEVEFSMDLGGLQIQ